MAEANATDVPERAAERLAAGDVDGAEFLLLESRLLGTNEAVDDLLGRIRRASNSQAILATLTELSREEFEALAEGTSVPEVLQFPERALTARAVETALAQLDKARALRARR